MSDVSAGTALRSVKVRVTKGKIGSLRAQIKQYYDVNGYLSWSESKKKYVILGSNEPKDGLVPCPDCKVGKLLVVRSRKTKKRFMGCSNYYNGCKASSPLIQKAMLCVTREQCKLCRWPCVLYRYSKRQKWNRQCSNIRCPSRAKS